MELPFLSKALGVRHTGPIFISHFLLNFFTIRPVKKPFLPVAETPRWTSFHVLSIPYYLLFQNC